MTVRLFTGLVVIILMIIFSNPKSIRLRHFGSDVIALTPSKLR